VRCRFIRFKDNKGVYEFGVRKYFEMHYIKLWSIIGVKNSNYALLI